jgi:hypothetical protein
MTRSRPGALQVELLAAEMHGDAARGVDALFHAEHADVEIGDGIDVAARDDEMVEVRQRDHRWRLPMARSGPRLS